MAKTWKELNEGIGRQKAAAPSSPAGGAWAALNERAKAAAPAKAAPKPSGIKTVDLSRFFDVQPTGEGAGDVRIGPKDTEIPGLGQASRKEVTQPLKEQKRKEAGLKAEKAQVDHVVPLGLGGTNASKNLVARSLKEAQHKDKVAQHIMSEVKAGRMGHRESIVRMQRWRDQDIPGQKAWNKTLGQQIRQAASATGEAVKTVGIGTPVGLAKEAVGVAAQFGDVMQEFTKELGRGYTTLIRAGRATSQLASTPAAFGISRATGGKETYTELSQESARIAMDIMRGREPTVEAARQYVARRREERGGKAPSALEVAHDLAVLSVIGLSDLAGDPAFAASGLVKVADEAVNFVRFRKVGQRIVGAGAVPEVVTREGRVVAPTITKLKDKMVEIPVSETQKVRLTPTKEGAVIVEGYETRFGSTRKTGTSTVQNDPKLIGAAVRDVTEEGRLIVGRQEIPVGNIKVAPDLFQLSRLGEMKTGLLNKAGAEIPRVRALTEGKGFDPQRVRQNPVLMGRMLFDDPQAGIKSGDTFLISGHNRLQIIRDAGLEAVPPDMYRIKEYDTLAEAVRDSIAGNVEGKVTAYDHNIVELIRQGAIDERDLIDIYGGDSRKAYQVSTIAKLFGKLPENVWDNTLRKLSLMKSVEQRIVDRKFSAFETLGRAVEKFPELATNEQYRLRLADEAAKVARAADDASMKAIENRIAKIAQAKTMAEVTQTDLFGAIAAAPEKPTAPAPEKPVTSKAPTKAAKEKLQRYDLRVYNPDLGKDEIFVTIPTTESDARVTAKNKAGGYGYSVTPHVEEAATPEKPVIDVSDVTMEKLTSDETRAVLAAPFEKGTPMTLNNAWGEAQQAIDEKYVQPATERIKELRQRIEELQAKREPGSKAVITALRKEIDRAETAIEAVQAALDDEMMKLGERLKEEFVERAIKAGADRAAAEESEWPMQLFERPWIESNWQDGVAKIADEEIADLLRDQAAAKAEAKTPEAPKPAPALKPIAAAAKAVKVKKRKAIAKKQPKAPGTQGGTTFANVKGNGFPETPVLMGSLDAIRPLEMPELVRLARELMGRAPQVKKLKTSLGYMKAEDKGKIVLDQDIFKNYDEQTVAKVLAHELGHLTDYHDDLDIRRGNLLGRVMSLKKFMLNELGEDQVTNAELREELKAWTRSWHPFDDATASPGYLQYRDSSVELYADALSGLFVTPGLVEQKAPKFYKAFFELLDRKPEFKSAYFEIQKLLQGGRETVLESRQKDIRQMFVKGEELRAALEEEHERARHDSWTALRIAIDDKAAGVRRKVAEAEAKGEVVSPADDPRFAIEELGLADAENFRMFQDINEQVLKPLTKAGLTQHDIGEYMFLKRIAGASENAEVLKEIEAFAADMTDAELEMVMVTGPDGTSITAKEAMAISGVDRAKIANPLGFVAGSAREQLEFLKGQIGEAKFAELEAAAQAFHDIMFRAVEEAATIGVYNKETFANIIKPNRNIYVTYGVLHHLTRDVAAAVRQQKGTFSEIENPFITTLMKTSTLNRLNAHQRAVKSTQAFLAKSFPAEIAPTKRQILKGGVRGEWKPEKGRDMLKVFENGQIVAYDVDPYIAKAFERGSVSMNAVASMLSTWTGNKFFRATFITYNAGFQVFNFIRDFKRTYRNLHALGHGVSMVKLVAEYMKAVNPAIRRQRGVSDKLITEMLEDKALDGTTFTEFAADIKDDSFWLMAERLGFVDQKTREVTLRRKLLTPLVKIMDALRFSGSVIETLPKVAGYNVMKEKEVDEKLRGHITRNFIGTPPFRTRGEWSKITNELALFSNIMIQGMKTDLALATRPTTRSGWWWKLAMTELAPKFLMWLAGAGLLGAELKRQMDKATEYDKTNYIVIPLGEREDGQAVYMRLPHDETARIVAGLFWKSIGAVTKGDDNWKDLVNIAGGQLPSWSPAIGISGDWLEFLRGRNPYDDFRGREVLSPTVFEAGGLDAWSAMVRHTVNETGLSRFLTFDPKRTEGLETITETMPIVNRLLRVTDYGLTERLEEEATRPQRRDDARRILKERRIVDAYILRADDLDEDELDALKDEMVMEAIGHEPETPAEKRKATNLKKRFDVSVQIGYDDPVVNRILFATSNAEKVKALQYLREILPDDRFSALIDELHELKVVSDAVLDELGE